MNFFQIENPGGSDLPLEESVGSRDLVFGETNLPSHTDRNDSRSPCVGSSLNLSFPCLNGFVSKVCSISRQSVLSGVAFALSRTTASSTKIVVNRCCPSISMEKPRGKNTERLSHP